MMVTTSWLPEAASLLLRFSLVRISLRKSGKLINPANTCTLYVVSNMKLQLFLLINASPTELISNAISVSASLDQLPHILILAKRECSIMAGKHPVHIHPVRPLYRFAATGLGASMWFFVSSFLSFKCRS